MDSIKQSAMTRRKCRLGRKFTNVLHILQVATTIHEKVNHQEDEKLQNRAAMDALIARVFATLSSVKSAYAELQYAQSPYDPERIQSADQVMISELKILSELKQYFLKNHLEDFSPSTTILLAEIQEQKNLTKTYEITRKKLKKQSRLKDFEIVFLKEKLEEIERENRLIERRLISSGPLSRHENLEFSKLNPSDFVLFLKHAVKSIRSLVKLMINEMEYANWDIDVVVGSIEHGVNYWNTTDRCYAFESFICREMFDGFDHPSFLVSGDGGFRPRTADRRRFFFDRFMELKYLKPKEYITWKPTSTFAEFCWFKYLQLVHPKMELSLFGNLNQRNLVSVGKFPETTFFESFAEAAKRIWLLHCLAFSFDPEGASVFQVRKGSHFSEVSMEGVNEDAFLSSGSSRDVAFTVVPGFKLGKTIVQCQVYMS